MMVGLGQAAAAAPTVGIVASVAKSITDAVIGIREARASTRRRERFIREVTAKEAAHREKLAAGQRRLATGLLPLAVGAAVVIGLGITLSQR